MTGLDMNNQSNNYLMNKKIRTFAVCIISNDNSMAFTSMYLFQNLKGFGSWCSTHIQHDTVRMNIQEHWWKHTHSLLTTNMTRKIQSNHVLMKFLECLNLSQLLTMNINLELQYTSIPTCHAPSSSYHSIGWTHEICWPSYSTVPSKWYLVLRFFFIIS